MTQPIIYKLNKYTAMYSCVATIALIMALPIALPIMKDNLKTAASDKLRSIADDLKPDQTSIDRLSINDLPDLPIAFAENQAVKYPPEYSQGIVNKLGAIK